jgi:hypothetical protein
MEDSMFTLNFNRLALGLGTAWASPALSRTVKAERKGKRRNPNGEALTHYRIIEIEGLPIFYREAGPADGPVVLLLHGWPSSSRMFRNLIPSSRIAIASSLPTIRVLAIAPLQTATPLRTHSIISAR